MSSALGRRRAHPGATLFADAGPTGPTGPAAPNTAEDPGVEAAGTRATRGTHLCGDADERRRATAFLARVAVEAAEALATPDPDLDDERAGVATACAAEARGLHGAPLPEPEHGGTQAALLAVSAQRPPAWPDQSSRPTAGCRCTRCDGRRWWAPEHPVLDGTGLASGWRCATCHPPPFVARSELLQVLT